MTFVGPPLLLFNILKWKKWLLRFKWRIRQPRVMWLNYFRVMSYFFSLKFGPFPALLGLLKMFFSFTFLWETLTREWDTTSQASKLHFLLKPNLTSHLYPIMKPRQFEFDIIFWPISALKPCIKVNSTFGTFSDTCLWSCQHLLAAPRGWQGTRKNGGHQFELVAVDPLRFRQLLVLLEKL